VPLRFVREPAVWMTLLASTVQVWRAYPVDILLFVGILGLMASEWPRTRDRLVDATPGPLAPAPRVLGTVVVVGYGVLVSLVPQTTWWLDACLAVAGVVALRAVVRPPAPATHRATRTPVVPRNWWLWPVLAASLALVELYSFLSQAGPRTDSEQHPTVSTLVEPILTHQPTRAIGIVAWALVGWWLVRRIRAWSEVR